MRENRIGEELRQMRIGHGFRTVKKFTETSGIPYSTYYPLEKGIKLPKKDTLIRIAEFYKMPSDDLVERIEAMKKAEQAEKPMLELPMSFEECSIMKLRIIFGNLKAAVDLIELYQAEMKHSKKTNISRQTYQERLEMLRDKLLEP